MLACALQARGKLEHLPLVGAGCGLYHVWTDENQWTADAATIDAAHAERLVQLARADGFTVECGG